MEVNSRAYRSPASWQELRDYVQEHRVIWVKTRLGALVCAAQVSEISVTLVLAPSVRIPRVMGVQDLELLLLPC